MVCIINITMRLQDLFENLDDDNKIQVMSKAVWRHIDPQISSTGSFKPIKLGEIPAFRGANLPLQLDNPTIDLMRKGTGDLRRRHCRTGEPARCSAHEQCRSRSASSNTRRIHCTRSAAPWREPQ